jgi:hypothetical protein
MAMRLKWRAPTALLAIMTSLKLSPVKRNIP